LGNGPKGGAGTGAAGAAIIPGAALAVWAVVSIER